MTERSNRDHTIWALTTCPCPRCGREVDTKVVFRGGRVFELKGCPEHGVQEALIAENAERYIRLVRPAGDPAWPELLPRTRGVCPVCRNLVPARLVQKEGRILLERLCPEHGAEDSLVSSNADYYRNSLSVIKPGTIPLDFRTK